MGRFLGHSVDSALRSGFKSVRTRSGVSSVETLEFV